MRDAAVPAVRWLTPDAHEALLARLARAGTLVAPVDVDGEAVFRPVRDPARILHDLVNTLVPPRDLFLPSPETLLAYRIEDGAPRVVDGGHDAGGAAPERVVYGIRPCDVAGLAYLERLLSGAPFARPDLADAPFARRRAAATLLCVTCDAPGDTCACVCCGGGPALEEGFDWQLTRLARGWLVEIGSARGEALAARVADLLAPPPPGSAGEKAARVRETVARFHEGSARRVPTMAASRMVSAGRLGEAFWTEVGERCSECGGCAFVCPTCSCFNVADVRPPGEAPFEPRGAGDVPAVPGGPLAAVADGTYLRVRTRDGCTLAGFVRQAGGGYPRWTCGERCLTRFFHKLSAQFHARLGAPGCTGCGRCIVVCLGEEGIDRVAQGMEAALLAGRGRAGAAGEAPPLGAPRAARAAHGPAAPPPAAASGPPAEAAR
uniref:4Fe-4S ferredoxin-type domain-containing protein n=1 Tax=Eiseniibacteriota bacterium TaxID=2212470 RepID=A0A832I0C7_UNCEI